MRIFKKRTEGDAPVDQEMSRSRPTGGKVDPNYPDANSTTGTTPNGTFVGRVGGDDVGYCQETGAERRAMSQD